MYGPGPGLLTSNDNQLLTVTVPALSTVVYRYTGYFHDVSSIPDGTQVTYRAVVRDNANHERTSDPQVAVVPEPKLTIELPTEGAEVFGTIEIRVTTDPERASRVVRIQRKLSTDADWVTLKTDDSSPMYTYYDNLSAVPLDTQIQYRAVLDEPYGTQVISPIRTVTRTAPTPVVTSVTVAGSLQSEIGCEADWDPACAASHLTFNATNGGLWEGTFQLPAGNYEYKVAIDDSWTVNYGAGGARNGANITLNLPTPASVTFVWDQVSHIVTHTTN